MKKKCQIVRNKDEIEFKKISIFLNYALGSPPLELHSSVIEDLLQRNNDVTVYVCGKQLDSCTPNASKSNSVCRYCEYRSSQALKKFKGKIKIKKISLEEFDIVLEDQAVLSSLKLGVMSSMASAVKAQSYNQLSEKWKRYHDNMLASACKLYLFFMKEIESKKIDYLFMFNGRFGEVKPVLEAARSSNIGYGLYEVKKSLHDVVFVNELVHSIEGNTRKALEFYVEDINKAKENAQIFFDKKVKNQSTGDPIYTEGQESGLLPGCILSDEEKRLIVAIYPTTDDEYKFIGAEWDGFVPDDQVVEIEYLAKNLNPEKYLLVVKMHPNQANTAENIFLKYISLQNKYSHVYVEEPLSKKDTYALMIRADFIVNFASTIGVEACYARKVVIMIGDTTFSKMNIGYRTESGSEAASLIKSGKLLPKSIRGAIIWGNYLSSYSDGLKSFKRLGNGEYVVDGKPVARGRFLRLLQLPSKFFLELSKPGHSLNLAFYNKAVDTIKNLILGKWKVK